MSFSDSYLDSIHVGCLGHCSHLNPCWAPYFTSWTIFSKKVWLCVLGFFKLGVGTKTDETRLYRHLHTTTWEVRTFYVPWLWQKKTTRFSVFSFCFDSVTVLLSFAIINNKRFRFIFLKFISFVFLSLPRLILDSDAFPVDAWQFHDCRYM